MSSRAITSAVIKDLFDFNNQPQYRTIEAYKAIPHQDRVTGNWGGPRARLLVHAVVAIAFSCLLRIDEALNLRAVDVTILCTECISINLSQRKTNPYGGMTQINPDSPACDLTPGLGIKPFILWRLDDDERHLCPVRALAMWLQATKIRSGFLFRPIASGDRVSSDDCAIVGFSRSLFHLQLICFIELSTIPRNVQKQSARHREGSIHVWHP
jgi:hypothetical protein